MTACHLEGLEGLALIDVREANTTTSYRTSIWGNPSNPSNVQKTALSTASKHPHD